MLSSTQFNLFKVIPLLGVILRNRSFGHAFFRATPALGLCYKSVKKMTFSGHATVMTVVKNSAQIIHTTEFCHPY